MKPYLLFILVNIYWAVPTFGVRAQDSLLIRLATSRDVYEKIDILHQVSDFYLYKKPDSAIYYANQALRLSRQVEDAYREVRSIYYQASGYRIGGNVAMGLKLFHEGLKRAETLGMPDQVAVSHINIGLIYMGMGNYPLAKSFFEKSLWLVSKIENKRLEATIYNNLAYLHIYEHRYDTASLLLQKALPLILAHRPEFEPYTLRLIGMATMGYHQPDSAIQLFRRALASAERYSDNSERSIIWRLMAEAELSKGKVEQAKQYALSAILVADEAGIRRDACEAYLTLSKVFEARQRYKDALLYKKMFIACKDSLNTSDLQDALQLFEIEQMQAQIRQLEDAQTVKMLRYENTINRQYAYMLFMILIAIVAIVAFAVVRRSHMRAKEFNKQLMEANAEIQESKDAILSQNEELKQQREQIGELITYLEQEVEERNRSLLRRHEQLNRYAFFNAHKLRGPIATLLGLYQLLELGINGQERESVIEKIKYSITELDQKVREGQRLLDEENTN